MKNVARHTSYVVRRLMYVTPAVLTACHFVDLSPGGAQRDAGSLQAVASSFYRAMARRDDGGLDKVTLPAATALLDNAHDPAVLVPMRTMVRVPERRNQAGVRIVRTELRPDGNIATGRIILAARNIGGRGEMEATDYLSLVHRDGAWRVAHAAFGPWRNRSAQ